MWTVSTELSDIVPSFKRGVSKVGGFALSAMLSGAANVLTIPFVVGSVGASAWAAIATGQAVGAIGSVIIQMGWGITGPNLVAKAGSSAERIHIYRESLYFRFLILGPVLIAVFLISWFVVAQNYSLAAAIGGVGSALFGLSAGWFLVGKGEPSKLILLDTIPRSAVVIVGALVVTQLQNQLIFASSILVSSLAPFLLSTFFILRGSRRQREVVAVEGIPRRTLRAVFADQWPGVTTSLIASSYKYLPLIFISTLVPAQAPAYALVDRVLKFAIAGVRPASQALQGWVPKGAASAMSDRIRFATKAAFGVGAVAGIGFLAVGPLLTLLIGGNEIHIGWNLLVPASMTLALGTVSQTTGMACLTARGRIRAVAFSAAAGATVCLIIIWPAVVFGGAEGAIWSVALAEAVVMVIQLLALRRSR